ncbi:MAG: D-glycero-beta-D-manno-heptose 1-phosphate adenylyltransferase, partial [Candidatus Binatia bacterium]
PWNVSGKLKSLDELQALVAEARANGKVVVFTNGCFDLLHRGHVHLLREAKALGNVLIVGINSDASVQALKGKSRPILSETDRIELIAAMEMVDYVVIFTEPDPLHVISVLRPDILVKGGDWSPDRIIGADVVEAEGGKVAVIPYVKGFSTTEIIDKVRS